MRKNLFFWGALVVLCSSCVTVPLTGRTQIGFIPAETMLSMSYQQHDEFLKSSKISTDEVQLQRVRAVGKRIQGAVEQYMSDNGLSHRLKNYQWEFTLIEDPAINAWCMPGGKVVVYTGILPVAGDDNGLAVVIAHEIAHAIAEHGNERMSQAMLAQLGGTALSVAMQNKPEQTKQLWMTVFNAGAQYGVLLPYSRLQENEADHLGLLFMAMAGYDPRAALTFWEAMAVSKAGGFNPEFLSTHPSDESRIRNIRVKINDALRYYTPRRD